MPSRFVILHHTTPGGEHWDLMLEHGDVLLTWQLLKEPTGPESLPIPAKRIGDHRKLYLDYEGPLSGGRGEVSRVESGTVEFTESDDEYFQFQLRGSRLVGDFQLVFLRNELVLAHSATDSCSSKDRAK